MVEHIPKNPTKKPTLNIAGHEISVILNIDEPYAIARRKFEILRNHCMLMLWITEDNPSLQKKYIRTMDHYLRNSANYMMDTGDFKHSTPEEIDGCKKNYMLFLSVVARIGALTKKQKNSFLEQMKLHHDADWPTENPIVVMDRILSSL